MKFNIEDEEVKKRIREYREKELMGNIPFDILFNQALSVNAKERVFDREDVIHDYELNTMNMDNSFQNLFYENIHHNVLYGNKFITYEINPRQRQKLKVFLKNYLDGLYDNKRTVIIENQDGSLRYFLITCVYHHSNNPSFKIEMNNIMLMPKSLYDLQLFIQGRYDELDEATIEDIINILGLEKTKRRVLVK
jgi:hypothetical protein